MSQWIVGQPGEMNDRLDPFEIACGHVADIRDDGPIGRHCDLARVDAFLEITDIETGHPMTRLFQRGHDARTDITQMASNQHMHRGDSDELEEGVQLGQ